MCLSVYLSVRLSVHVSICLLLQLSRGHCGKSEGRPPWIRMHIFPPIHSLSVSVYLCLSMCVCLVLSASFCLRLSDSVCLSLSVSFCLCLSMSPSMYACLFLSSLSVQIYLSVLSFYLCMDLSVHVCLCLWLNLVIVIVIVNTTSYIAPLVANHF